MIHTVCSLIPFCSSRLLPPAHANVEAQRLAQETLAGLENLLVRLELVATEDGRDDERELHLLWND